MEVDTVQTRRNNNSRSGQRPKDLKREKRFQKGAYLNCGKQGHQKKDYLEKSVKMVEVKTLKEDPQSDLAIIS